MTEPDSISSKPAIAHLSNRVGVEGAVALSTSIGAQEFQLVYNAKEEPLGGGRKHIAETIVNFCNHYDCGYVVITDGNCWISGEKGISFLAQIENSEELDQYDLIVMPLDSVIYVAEISEGLVVSEKVSPADQAIISLLEHKERRLAILNGGTATEQLKQQGLPVNCEEQLFAFGKEAKPYHFQPLTWALITNRFYHKKLLLHLGVLLACLGLISHLFIFELGSEDIQDIKALAEDKILAIVKEKPPNYLNNNASQQFQQITPWITGKTADFLKTCRLKKINIKNDVINFSGQRMRASDRSIGCGEQRLKSVVQNNQLNLSINNNNWSFDITLNPIIKQPRERTIHTDTIERLELLAQYINWQIQISSTQSKGDHQKITVVLNGNQLSTQTLRLLANSFSEMAAQLAKASLTFNPESLKLLDARFELSIYTKSRLAS